MVQLEGTSSDSVVQLPDHFMADQKWFADFDYIEVGKPYLIYKFWSFQLLKTPQI